MPSHLPLVVIPGDDPPMIAGSPHLDRLRERANVVLHTTRPHDEAELVARAQGATVILNSRGIVRWPAAVLRQLPELKLISCCAIGVDCVDLATAREQGIVVTNVPGRTATIVAEHALALLLGTARRLAYNTAELKQGRWSGRQLISLTGKRLGVIGTGNTGCELIRLARAIGLEVVAWSFHPSPEKAQRLGFRYVERAELLRTSDAVSIHLKLTAESRGLIDAAALGADEAWRGFGEYRPWGNCRSSGAVAALHSGCLSGAGLDVFETEPLAPDDPLLSCEQVVLTPHNADNLPEGFDALSSGGVDNVLAFLDGAPRNVV